MQTPQLQISPESKEFTHLMKTMLRNADVRDLEIYFCEEDLEEQPMAFEDLVFPKKENSAIEDLEEMVRGFQRNVRAKQCDKPVISEHPEEHNVGSTGAHISTQNVEELIAQNMGNIDVQQQQVQESLRKVLSFLDSTEYRKLNIEEQYILDRVCTLYQLPILSQ